MHDRSRRAFLLAVLLTPAVRLRGGAQPQRTVVSLEDFVRLSEAVVGRTNLDRKVAAIYFDALKAEGTSGELLERKIIECWYTGTYTAPDGRPRLATHTGALMWSALGMPAPGTCTGSFGAWSRPPRQIA